MAAVGWRRKELLGSGSFGRVYAAEDTSSGRVFAVKSVAVLANAPSSADVARRNHDLDALENEIAVLSQLQHPNVVAFLGADTTQESGKSHRNLHMELASAGNIGNAVSAHGGSLPLQLLQQYTRDILSGLQYLHSKNVVHGDIKGLNLLLTSQGSVKLADFGSARKLHTSCNADSPSSSRPLTPYQKRVGTANWMSPEAAVGHSELDTSADIWSLGCTVLEMVTGKPAWSEVDGGSYAVLFALACTESMPVVSADLPADVASFIHCCLRRDRAARWTAEQLLRHPLVSSIPIPMPSDDTNDDVITNNHSACPSLNQDNNGTLKNKGMPCPAGSCLAGSPIPSLVPASPTSPFDGSLFQSSSASCCGAASPIARPGVVGALGRPALHLAGNAFSSPSTPSSPTPPSPSSPSCCGALWSPRRLTPKQRSSPLSHCSVLQSGKRERERKENEGREKKKRVGSGAEGEGVSRIPLIDLLRGCEEEEGWKWPEKSLIMPRGAQWIVVRSSSLGAQQAV